MRSRVTGHRLTVTSRHRAEREGVGASSCSGRFSRGRWQVFGSGHLKKKRSVEGPSTAHTRTLYRRYPIPHHRPRQAALKRKRPSSRLRHSALRAAHRAGGACLIAHARRAASWSLDTIELIKVDISVGRTISSCPRSRMPTRCAAAAGPKVRVRLDLQRVVLVGSDGRVRRSGQAEGGVQRPCRTAHWACGQLETASRKAPRSPWALQR